MATEEAIRAVVRQETIKEVVSFIRANKLDCRRGSYGNSLEDLEFTKLEDGDDVPVRNEAWAREIEKLAA